MAMMRTFPNLKAKRIINKCLAIIKMIPEPLYNRLVKHPLDLSSATR